MSSRRKIGIAAAVAGSAAVVAIPGTMLSSAGTSLINTPEIIENGLETTLRRWMALGGKSSINWDANHRDVKWTTSNTLRIFGSDLGSIHVNGDAGITPLSDRPETVVVVAAEIKGSGLLRIAVPLVTAYGQISARLMLRNMDRGLSRL